MTTTKELVELVLKGDTKAMNELIANFQGMAVGFAWSMVGDHHLAEDLAQDAFIQAIKSINRLNNPAAFPLWFKTILRYTCIRALQKPKTKQTGLEAAEAQSIGPTPEDSAVSGELRQAVWRSINQLAEEDRSILVLYYFEELTQKQVAAFLGLDEYKVNNRLHALRKILKKEWVHLADYKPSKDRGDFRRRVLDGIGKIGYTRPDAPPMLTQFCASLSVALPAIGASPYLDYTDVAAASGAAFRMLWKEGWHPDNVDILYAMEDSFEPMRRAFEATGCSVEICICDGSAMQWGHNQITGALCRNELQAKHDIVGSIDSGMPVLALGVIGPPECCIVTGYDEDGQVLIGYNYFQDFIKEEGLSTDDGGRFHKRNWFKGTAAYMLIKECKPVSPGREQLEQTLRLAVQMAHTPEVCGRASGLAAYRAWADQLLHDEEYVHIKQGDGDMNFAGKGTADFADDVTGRFGMFCDPFLMIGERASAATFCDRAADALPQCQAELKQAAALYRKMAENPNDLWQRLGLFEASQERFRDPDVRSILAGHVLRLRLLDEQAISCIEKAIKMLAQ